MFLVTNYKVVLNNLFPPNCVTRGNNEKQRVTTNNKKIKETKARQNVPGN